MEAQRLLDLWEAIEERRTATMSLLGAEPDAHVDIQVRIAALNQRIVTMQENVWNVYTPKYVRCRDVGHVWDVQNEQINEYGHLVRVLSCYRCRTQRKDEVDREGFIQSRGYHHPGDYLMPKGSHGQRYGKSFWRGLTFMVVAKQGKST